jgi:methionyl-tRNA formyltransferase
VRAFVPWPIAAARWRGAALKVHEAVPVDGAQAPPGTITAADASGVTVATGAGSLKLLRVQLAGRSVVSAAEFARAAAQAGALAGARFDSAA